MNVYIKKHLSHLHVNSPLPIYIKYLPSLLKELYLVERVQYYSRERLNSLQNYNFRKLINHVFNNVKFYNKWLVLKIMLESNRVFCHELPQ